MTDQTVPVPVDLLNRIEDEVYYSSYSPLKELRGYIPHLPKVGDTLTAVQAYNLPSRSTFVDDDGDIYVVYAPRKIKRVTNAYTPNVWAEEDMLESEAELSDYTLTITHLPKETPSV